MGVECHFPRKPQKRWKEKEDDLRFVKYVGRVILVVLVLVGLSLSAREVLSGGGRFAAQAAQQKTSNENSLSEGDGLNHPGQCHAGVAGITVKLSHDPPDGAPLSAGTDENGHYEFLNLPPGSYSITIEARGFKTIKRSVVVNRNQQSVQDFSLQFEHRI